jgi:lipopolysaccharide/colanic/teichoic acid biosynthesis glycosyltransferase
MKRMLDIGATVIGGTLILPLLLTLSLLVWLESGRPVFYADKRMGRQAVLVRQVQDHGARCGGSAAADAHKGR